MGVLLVIGGGDGWREEVSALVGMPDLTPMVVAGYREALSQLGEPALELVIVGTRSPAEAAPAWWSALLKECAVRGIPLLYLGAGADTPPGAWELAATGLFALLSPEASAAQLRAKIALLLEVRRLRRELDRKNLEIEVLQQELAEFSSLDPETGLFGRRYFLDHLAKEWRQAERRRAPMVLLRLEVEAFGMYCQERGREEGAARLCAVARALYSSLLRPSDLLARVDTGGFAILLPETEEGGAEQVARRLRRAVAAVEIAAGDRPLGVRIAWVRRVPDGAGGAHAGWEHMWQSAEEALAVARGGDGDHG